MTEEATTRRLAAILFSDIVGYTAQMGEDEEGAIHAVSRSRELQRDLVERHDGEWLQEIGDGALAIFPSSYEAVSAALEIQAALAGDADLRVRIGVHEGDVVRRGHDIFGDGVNVAARLQAFATPGTICVSQRVWDDVRNKKGIEGTDLGEHTLKNVNRPVRIYALGAEAAVGQDAAVPGPLRRIPISVRVAAVLLIAAGLGAVGYAQNRPAIHAAVIMNLPRMLPPPVEQEIAFTQAQDGTTIAYATSGTGPAVVHVLGWFTHLEDGMNSPMFSVMPLGRWENRYRLVRFDGRGTGLSDRRVEDFSLEARVSDLEAVIDSLGLERFAIYAHSAGGPVAIRYTARHPERVTRLVFYGSFARINVNEEAEEKLRALASVARIGWGETNPAYRQTFTGLFMQNGDPVQQRVFSEFQRVAADGADVANFLESLTGIDERANAQRIGVPTLVIHVRGDGIVPHALGRELAAQIPGARFMTLEGNDHIMRVGSPGAEKADEAIEAFLDEAVAEAG
jgi:class 3 adenylate cyclase/pimeloyl-ACP methyl ester carboxylesterase